MERLGHHQQKSNKQRSLSCPVLWLQGAIHCKQRKNKIMAQGEKTKKPAIPINNALERKLLCQKTCGTVTSHTELPGICIYRILNKEGLMERLNIKEHQRHANSETSTETWHGLTSLPIFPDRICIFRLFTYNIYILYAYI